MKKNFSLSAFFLFSLALVLFSCASTNCGAMSKKHVGEPIKKDQDPMNQTSVAEHVWVYKTDGTVQCENKKPIPLDVTRKDLKEIDVYSAVNKNDGMMRIQVCGSPTGNCNVYEINRKDLEAALKLGFREWTGP